MELKSRLTTSAFKRRFINGGSPGSGDRSEVIVPESVQAISTEGHAFQNLGKTKGNIGGDFESQKIQVHLGGDSYPRWVRRPPILNGGPYAQEYFTLPVAGPDVATQMASVKSQGENQTKLLAYLAANCPLGFSLSNLVALGAKAIDQMSPTNPVADTAATLAEFFSERKFFNVPGNAGSAPGEYLNYQFGIAPTVGFAQDLRGAIQNREQIVDQLARDSGRLIRRKGTVFSDESGLSESITKDVYPSWIGGTPVTQVQQRGTLTITESVTRTSWFSGAFTYYLPKEGILRTVAELDKKYGVKPNVDTAWELLPFSWLVDYKVSAGAAVSNFSKFSSDGLVMPYAYIMGQQNSTTRYVWNGQIRDGSGSFRSVTLTATVEKTTKQRMRASPYGFGILPGDLSGRQLSILAALGLSYLK